MDTNYYIFDCTQSKTFVASPTNCPLAKGSALWNPPSFVGHQNLKIDMKLLTLEQYLSRYGVNAETPPERIAELKVAYRKWYQREYGRLRREREKDIKVRMTKEEYRQLKKAAKEHGYDNLSPFLKTMAFAYLDQRFIVPDESKLDELTIQVQRIGNNINQVVHHAHRMKRYDMKSTYEGLSDGVKRLKTEVQSAVKQPKNIFTVLEDVLKMDASLVGMVEDIIQKVKREQS